MCFPFKSKKSIRHLRIYKKKIPGILSVEIGTNYWDKNMNNEYTHTYLLTFVTKSDRDAFIPHPEREKLNSFLNNLDVVEKSFVMAYTPL